MEANTTAKGTKGTQGTRENRCICGHDHMVEIGVPAERIAQWTPKFPGHLPYCPEAPSGRMSAHERGMTFVEAEIALP